MHELPVVEKIFTIVMDAVKLNGVQRVISVTLETGALSDMEEPWITRYFRQVSRGTPAEGAHIFIVKQEALYRCRGCHYTWKTGSSREETCPSCGSGQITLDADSGCTVRDMEVI